MRIDMHCHMLGHGSDPARVDTEPYLHPARRNDLCGASAWATQKYIETSLVFAGADGNLDGVLSTGEYLNYLVHALRDSEEIDAVVLLALDAVYGPDGQPDAGATDLWVSNRYLHAQVQELNNRLAEIGAPSCKRFLWGASVNPNRADWREELAFVVEDTEAVLVKWIPSVQHIQVELVVEEFYRILATNGLPLLCHSGPEYAFSEGMRQANRSKDDFLHLRRPLECGVKVIAAHCALPVFPTDRDRFDEFRKFMAEMNQSEVRLWGDTSGFSLVTRLSHLSMVREAMPAEWLVHGTDFPLPVDNGMLLRLFLGGDRDQKIAAVRVTKNPFDRDVRIKRAFGFSDTILENAVLQNILRINPKY